MSRGVLPQDPGRGALPLCTSCFGHLQTVSKKSCVNLSVRVKRKVNPPGGGVSQAPGRGTLLPLDSPSINFWRETQSVVSQSTRGGFRKPNEYYRSVSPRPQSSPVGASYRASEAQVKSC